MADNAYAAIANATSAGWIQAATDRGAGWFPSSERHHVILEKPVVGPPLRAGNLLRSEGFGSSLANAQTQALAALNFQRKFRYGGDSAAAGKSGDGQTHVLDVT